MRKVSLIEADGFKARLSGSRPCTRTQAGLKTHLRSQVSRVSLPQMQSTSLKKALVHEAKPSAPLCTSTTCRTKMLSRSSRICDPFLRAPNSRRCPGILCSASPGREALLDCELRRKITAQAVHTRPGRGRGGAEKHAWDRCPVSAACGAQQKAARIEGAA